MERSHVTHESGWERQQLGTLWPAGTFVGELRTSRYGNLRSESGTTHSRARLHSVGMRHAGPVLRTSLVLARSRTASGGHTQHSLLLLVPAVTSARPTLFPARAGLERRLPPAQKALAFGRPLSSSGARTPARETQESGSGPCMPPALGPCRSNTHHASTSSTLNDNVGDDIITDDSDRCLSAC